MPFTPECNDGGAEQSDEYVPVVGADTPQFYERYSHPRSNELFKRQTMNALGMDPDASYARPPCLAFALEEVRVDPSMHTGSWNHLCDVHFYAASPPCATQHLATLRWERI